MNGRSSGLLGRGSGTREKRVGNHVYANTEHPSWFYPMTQQCEHCDGVRSPLTRDDRTRGLVCPDCDSSLDALDAEMADPSDSYYSPEEVSP